MSFPTMRDEHDWSSYILILNSAGTLSIFNIMSHNSPDFEIFLSYNLSLIYFLLGMMTIITIFVVELGIKNHLENYKYGFLSKLINNNRHKDTIISWGKNFKIIIRSSCLLLFALGSIQAYGTLVFSHECIYEDTLPSFLDNFLFNLPVKDLSQAQNSWC